MPYSDYFDRQVQKGYTGPSTTPYSSTFENRLPASLNYEVNDEIDRIWAAGQRSTQAPHQYFDYFFSGQDIKVYVDGTDDDPEFGDLPIMEMAWQVDQMKMPLYGFWSYTRDQMMRGIRKVSGQFTLATKSPDYMRRLLTKAAEARAQHKQSYYYPRGLTEDDRNIQTYWGKNLDPSIGSTGKQVFSVHPPFSMVVVYGVQNISINQISGSNSELWDKYQEDYPLALDVNERLVESDPLANSTRVILENIELSNFQTGYAPDGSVVAETWGFEARDIVIPDRPGTFNRPTRNPDDWN